MDIAINKAVGIVIAVVAVVIIISAMGSSINRFVENFAQSIINY